MKDHLCHKKRIKIKLVKDKIESTIAILKSTRSSLNPSLKFLRKNSLFSLVTGYNPLSHFNRYLLSFFAISQINYVFIHVYRCTDGVAPTWSAYTWEIRMARDYWFFFLGIAQLLWVIARPKKRRSQVEIGNSQRRTCLLLSKSLTSAHRLKRKLRGTCFFTARYLQEATNSSLPLIYYRLISEIIITAWKERLRDN